VLKLYIQENIVISKHNRKGEQSTHL